MKYASSCSSIALKRMARNGSAPASYSLATTCLFWQSGAGHNVMLALAAY